MGGLLSNLAARIARDFGTAVAPRDVWDEDLGDKASSLISCGQRYWRAAPEAVNA